MPTCFVVMGFGKKTDYATGRVLDLDMTYQNVIKPAALAAGLECVRADEIKHTGVIDVPMYEQLLEADVVVADLSTSNPNALYELGVRHALRPYATIVIAEEKMSNPFDINHTVMRRYVHLGDDIGYKETMRLRAELEGAMKAILATQQDDSPVYTYLKPLRRPTRGEVAAAAAATGAAGAAATPAEDTTIATLLAAAEEQIRADQFAAAIPLLQAARARRPSDPYITQRLVLATYKSKQPTLAEALERAHALLMELSPDVSTDPETLGLHGAIHKRLWETTHERRYLDQAIHSYEKGFYLRNDYYNGINLAYLLNVRAAASPPAEAIADFVQAQRVRRTVVAIGDRRLADAEHPPSADERYWLLATMAEAHLGIGDEAQSAEWLARAADAAGAAWMVDSTTSQLAALRALLADPPTRFIATDA